MGANLQKFLLLFYMIITVVYLFEHNWNKALYWVSAFFLTLAVLRMV